MIQTNYYDDQEYAAFRDNESRIKTDDRDMDELDEFSPENLDLGMKIYDTDETD